MPLTQDQFQKAKDSGFSTDQIIEFEKKRILNNSNFPIKQNIVNNSTPFLPNESKVNDLISKRPDSVNVVFKEASVPFDFKNKPVESTLKPLIMGMKVAAVPFQRAESTFAGLGLGLQKGKPLEGLRMAKEGLLGKRNYQAGDLIRTTGFGGDLNEGLASATGFTASLIAPIKTLNSGLNSMNKIQKFTDKGLMNAGNKLINGTEEAVKTMGSHLEKAYTPVNNIGVDTNKVINEIANLPSPIVAHIETELGENLENYFSNFNISKARKLKGLIGELKPNSFGKQDRGSIELITDKQVNKAYATIKQEMQNSLISSGMKKQAESLLNADDAFTETMNASRYIKNTVTNPILRKPTRVGRAASRLETPEDLSMRDALNTVKNAGGSARKNINKAIFELENFNKLKRTTKVLGILGRAAVYGGATGSTIRGILGQQEHGE